MIRTVMLRLIALVILVVSAGARGQVEHMPGYADTFALKMDERSYPYSAHLIECSAPGNVLWPGEQPTFTVQLVNNTKEAIRGKFKVELIHYATVAIPGDIWTPQFVKLDGAGSVPIEVDMSVGGFADVKVSPMVPATFGGYALVADLGPAGRQFITSFVRTFAAETKRIQYPHFCLDMMPPDLLQRTGAQAVRYFVSYVPTDAKDYEKRMEKVDKELKELQSKNVAVLCMINGGGPQPLAPIRRFLDENGVMKGIKGDMTWLPSSDDDFQKWFTELALKYAWPNGPINAFALWNEPWEGISISGWGADMLRYREIYTRMYKGVDAARAQGRQMLIGGCDSTSNAFDKIFGDGSLDFLPHFDFVSIHYQGLNSCSNVKMWADRKGPQGRVQIWDTESWVANTDDRVAAVVAADRAAGYDRAMGVSPSSIQKPHTYARRLADGKTERTDTLDVYPPAASVGAATHFIGERDFNQILFKNGLPWIFVFDGLPDHEGKNNPQDGTLVVVGDIGEEFEHDNLIFRNAHGLKNIALIAEAKNTLDKLPLDAPPKVRASAISDLQKAQTLTGSSLTLNNSEGKFSLFDFYGNPVPADGGKIVVPLDGRGFFLRSNGSPGSFAKLVDAVRNSHVDGIEPLAKACHDFTARIEQHPTLRLTLTNVLNRPVQGTLNVTIANLQLDPPSQSLKFDANQTKDVLLKVAGGASVPNNTYHLSLSYDAGADGRSIHEEDLHVNVIVPRTITVDGNLDDWKDVPPQPVFGGNSAPTVTEAAWYPFKKFDQAIPKGFANAYLAYDKDNFYFAAKIADDTPDEGMPRFETRDDEEFFYPEKSFVVDEKVTLEEKDETWEVTEKDAAALQKPGTTARIGSSWNSTTRSFAIDLKLPEGMPTQVAFYLLDRDEYLGGRRNVQINVLDAASGKALLRPQTVTKAHFGKWVVLNLSGNVRVKFTSMSFLSAAVGGVFFDPATPVAKPSKPVAGAGGAADFVKVDEETGGNWANVYGSKGYAIATLEPKLPPGVEMKFPTNIAREELVWPQGVRRYSYRKNPELPFGNALHDNVQIAFNVLPVEQKPLYPCPPGTMPGFTLYADTDYEYALNPVAPKYGGGTEIWRLAVPGMPHKHFYPRQPKSPYDGPVKSGKLVMLHDANTRIVEAAIPWSELLDVKKALDEGRTIKFSYRVNDNGNRTCMELSRDRSVAKRNPSFHPDWLEHWSNELEFAFEKP